MEVPPAHPRERGDERGGRQSLHQDLKRLANGFRPHRLSRCSVAMFRRHRLNGSWQEPCRDHPYRTTSNAGRRGGGGIRLEPRRERKFCLASEGHFSMPHGNCVTHLCSINPATLFVVTDREVLHRL